MADENANDGQPSRVGEDTHQVAARITQKLREAGLKSQIFNLTSADIAALGRDRIVIVAALALLTVSAWNYVVFLSADTNMGTMDMTGLRMIPSGTGLMTPADTPWRPMEFAFVFAMWAVMMVGMMTPSAAPMFLMYDRVGRQTKASGSPLAATAWFAAGYFLVWIVFSLFATLVQWALERSALLDFTMTSTSSILGGVVFVAAGLYQWTRLNEICLIECQRPFAFVIRHGGYRSDVLGCVMLGLRHGAYCVGCCWALMALLLVGGVMNILWIFLLALVAFLERVTSMGRLIARIIGIVLIAGGAGLFAVGMS